MNHNLCFTKRRAFRWGKREREAKKKRKNKEGREIGRKGGKKEGRKNRERKTTFPSLTTASWLRDPEVVRLPKLGCCFLILAEFHSPLSYTLTQHLFYNHSDIATLRKHLERKYGEGGNILHPRRSSPSKQGLVGRSRGRKKQDGCDF